MYIEIWEGRITPLISIETKTDSLFSPRAIFSRPGRFREWFYSSAAVLSAIFVVVLVAVVCAIFIVVFWRVFAIVRITVFALIFVVLIVFFVCHDIHLPFEIRMCIWVKKIRGENCKNFIWNIIYYEKLVIIVEN